MRHADDGRFGDGGMTDGDVLDLDGRDPFAAGLDDILGAVGDGHVTVSVNGRDIASVEPSLRIEGIRSLVAKMTARDRRPAHLQMSERLAVARQLPAFI